MKVWTIQAAGLDALTLTDRPEPQPQPGQVLLKMRAWSLNYRDLLMVKGAYGGKQTLPLVPLSDGVGEVVAWNCIGNQSNHGDSRNYVQVEVVLPTQVIR